MPVPGLYHDRHPMVRSKGPLERGIIKATNSGENFEGWVVGFYGEWSDTLICKAGDHAVVALQ